MEWTKLLVRTALILAILVLAIQVYYIYQLQSDFAATRGDAPVVPEAAAYEAGANQTNDKAEQPVPDEETKTSQTNNETEEPDQSVFLHQAKAENIAANSTYIDHPMTNGNPDAVLSVTQSFNPGGGPGTYNDHPIGVWYDSHAEKWAIFNQDFAEMTGGACFNVVALEKPTEAS